MSDRFYCFQHIEKAGGTTLTTLLERIYPPPGALFIDPYFNNNHPYHKYWAPHYGPESLEQARVLFGHHWFGMHEAIPDRPFSYFSVVRDPVDQLVSMYNYAAARDDHRLYPMTGNGFDRFIEQLASHDRLSIYLNNPQTQALTRSNRASVVLDRLEEHYCFLCPVENFDDLLPFLLEEHLGHTLEAVPERENVSKRKTVRDEITRATVDRIYTLNHLDHLIHRASLTLGSNGWKPTAALIEQAR